jgi:fructose-bisphosphate aldolase class 1
MNEEQLQKMKSHPGLDQSGGSTPHALALYGLKDHSWADDDESFPGYPSRARSRGQNRGAEAPVDPSRERRSDARRRSVNQRKNNGAGVSGSVA